MRDACDLTMADSKPKTATSAPASAGTPVSGYTTALPTATATAGAAAAAAASAGRRAQTGPAASDLNRAVVALLEHLEEQMDAAFTMVRLGSLATLMHASHAAACASLMP